MSKEWRGSEESEVYVLTRKTDSNLGPLSKIGFTSKSAETRASDYTDGQWAVSDRHPMPSWLGKLVERRAHNILREVWLDPSVVGGSGSEVFMCDASVASSAIAQAKEDCLNTELEKLGISSDLRRLVKGFQSPLTFAASRAVANADQSPSGDSVSSLLAHAATYLRIIADSYDQERWDREQAHFDKLWDPPNIAKSILRDDLSNTDLLNMSTAQLIGAIKLLTEVFRQSKSDQKELSVRAQKIQEEANNAKHYDDFTRIRENQRELCSLFEDAQITACLQTKARSMSPLFGRWINSKRTGATYRNSSPLSTYIEMFGHGPSFEAERLCFREELEQMAEDAIREGEPVEDWQQLPSIKYGLSDAF